MIYSFIKNNEGIFPIDKMCKVLEVGRRSYYWWKRSSASNKALRKQKFKKLITSVYFEFKQRLQEIEEEGEIFESIEDIWPDYPSKEDFFFNEDEY